MPYAAHGLQASEEIASVLLSLAGRQRDADGVTYCGHCGELRPDDRDELLAAMVVKLDRLEHLAVSYEESA